MSLEKLDIGCGPAKQRGFVGVDYMASPGVDVVHDITVTPWPFDSSSCSHVRMSHVIEHIPPDRRFAVIDEAWRVLHPTGQLDLECPLAGSVGEAAHLEHYPCPNEWSFTMFDPDFFLYHCRQPAPTPWRLVRNLTIASGWIGRCLVVRMEPRKGADGQAVFEQPARVIMPSQSPPIRSTSP